MAQKIFSHLSENIFFLVSVLDYINKGLWGISE